MGILVKFLVVAVAIYVISLVVPGVKLKSWKSALVVAGVFGLLNLLVGIFFPIAIVVGLLKIVTLGLFSIVFNAILLVVTDKLMDDFELSGFGAALLASSGITVVSLLAGHFLR